MGRVHLRPDLMYIAQGRSIGAAIINVQVADNSSASINGDAI